MSSETATKELIHSEQYSMSFAEKQERLLPLLEEQVAICSEAIPTYGSYLRSSWAKVSGFSSYADIPYLPVSVFKDFDLCAVPRERIVRVLHSSATTTGRPSKVYLDKPTAFRQSQAASAIFMQVLGKQQRPYLVLDCEEVNGSGSSLTARGAVLRSFMPFASSLTCGLAQNGDGLELRTEVLEKFFEENEGQPVLISGFTYIIWSSVIQQLQKRHIRFRHPEMLVLHSGGWKRLLELEVGREEFAERVAETFGCLPRDVRDFYGMVEQVGVIFVDCEAGNKHSPNFAEVMVRDPLTLRQVEPGQSGLIEVLSVLPTSYPGQALLTEDIGLFLGYEGCPCRRPGFHFRFQARVRRAEVRGCGDTFAATQRVVPDRPELHQRGSSVSQVEVVIGAPLAPGVESTTAFEEFRRALLRGFDAYVGIPTSAFVGLLDAVGRNVVSPEFSDVEGIAFLSTWLRRSNLEKLLRLNLGAALPALNAATELEGSRIRAMPRGLVCHWVAGNIPTLAFFSWALATLAKNASIIRVPDGSRQVVQRLFRAVELASIELDGKHYDGSVLLERTRIVHFPSTDQRLNEAMSLAADARVVWGGAEAVRAVTGYPRLEHCEDLVFGPKFSVGAVDRDTMQNDDARTAALTAFMHQVVMFEQTACSSPQILFVEATGLGLQELAALVEKPMMDICSRFPKRQIEDFTACQILSTRANYGLRADTWLRASADLTYTVLVERGALWHDALQSRTVYVMVVDDLMEVLPLLSQKVQTVGMAIRDQTKARAFAEAAALAGVARCVPPSLMNIYETPWDGMLPLNRLVRWCRV